MLRRFSIRQVIIGALGGVTAVALVAIASLVWTAASMSRTVEQQSQRLIADEDVAHRLVLHVQNQLIAAQRFIDSRDEELLERFRAEGIAAYDQIRLYLALDLSSEERLLVERLRERHQEIEVAAQRVFAAADTRNATLPGALELEGDLMAFLALRRAETERLLVQQRTLWRWMSLACAVLVLVFLGTLITTAFFLRGRLLEPLSALSFAARRIGRGRFDVRVAAGADDELGALAHSFNRMAERLEQARRDAQAAEHRFRDLIEGVATVLWEGDAETLRCTYVSPQALAMFGYPLEQWTTTDIWRTIIHPDDYDAAMQIGAGAPDNRRDQALEYRAIRADGSTVHIREFIRVLHNEDGRAVRLRGVMTDVTELRAADEALRASEQRYHSLVDRVPVGLYRSTPDGRMIEVNAALLGLLGYDSREELMLSNAADVYLEPAEREHWQRMLDLADGAVEVDRQHRRRDGRLIWLRDTARAIRDATGEVRYYEGALQDVTERVSAEEALRRSEARFRSLIENATDGVIILTADGRIRYQSPAVERMLGYTPEEMDGRSPFELVHPEDLHDVRESFANVMSPEGHGRSVEFRAQHRDGSWRMLHVLGTNLLHDPAVGGVVVNMIDSTTHRSLQAQLQHAQRLEAVGRLAGGIAHDFNNLLTAIRGYTDMLDDRVEDSRAHADVVEIRRAVERAARLTRQLLAFSRRQVVRPRPTDLGAVILDLDQMLKRLLTESVPLHTSARGECWVQADPVQLEQIVVNLVINARDAEPSSGITVTVEPITISADTAPTGLEPGEYVMLTVSDDGCGIDAETLPLIFEPFFTTKEVGQGTGLGLATVYGIVQDAGGHIVADSTPGVGTVMRVYVPRIEAPEPERVFVEPVTEEPGSGTEMVLLVEDEPAVRSLTERVLMRHGYRVLSAANGVEALELAGASPHPIDLLITDVVMPGMGGVQLAERLLEVRPHTQVLFISGYAADSVPLTDFRGRQLHFLEKPFSPAAFAEYVRKILDDAKQPA